MGEDQNPKAPQSVSSSSSSSSSTSSSTSRSKTSPGIENGPSFSIPKMSYPNPPDPTNPDPATLRDQWRYAIRQYSRWYSQAWGTAILAGVSFFALGWIIKGSNPLPSFKGDADSSSSERDDGRQS